MSVKTLTIDNIPVAAEEPENLRAKSIALEFKKVRRK